jgi:NAD(P)-dependent dehydrogenase (short-subunit alcohol dehydrogenase family)
VNANPKGLTAPLLAHGTRTRWAAMRQAGAVGVIAVGAGGAWVDNENTRLGSSVSLADTSLDDLGGQRLNSVLNPSLMPRLLAGSGIVWDSVVAVAARGEPLPTAPLRVSLRASLPTVRREIVSPNVVGMLPGTDRTLRDEVVVLSAHLDHVGTFKGPALTGDSIFNGTMDNATGAATLMETDVELFERHMRVNQLGCFIGMKAVVPLMEASGGGSIVNISSVAGKRVSTMTGPAYSAAKFGLNAMTESINIEEGIHGIRATAVCPGEVATPILDKRPIPVSADDRAKMVQPNDCGELMLFLARLPAHVCINELMITPTWNRGYIAQALTIPE